VVFYTVSLKVFPKQNIVWSVVEISNKNAALETWRREKKFIISTLRMTAGRFLPRFMGSNNKKYYKLQSMKNAYIFFFFFFFLMNCYTPKIFVDLSPNKVTAYASSKSSLFLTKISLQK
jgi:hypothetical protein